MKDLPKRLKQIRGKLTQAEFAEILGISTRSLSRYETGVGSPDLATIEKISAKCGVSPEWLVFGQKPPGILGETDHRIKELEKQLAEAKEDALNAYKLAARYIPPPTHRVQEPPNFTDAGSTRISESAPPKSTSNCESSEKGSSAQGERN